MQHRAFPIWSWSHSGDCRKTRCRLSKGCIWKINKKNGGRNLSCYFPFSALVPAMPESGNQMNIFDSAQAAKKELCKDVSPNIKISLSKYDHIGLRNATDSENAVRLPSLAALGSCMEVCKCVQGDAVSSCVDTKGTGALKGGCMCNPQGANPLACRTAMVAE